MSVDTLPNHLGRLPLSLMGHGTGINNIEVGLPLKGNGLPSQGLISFQQAVGFELVDLATQGVNRYPERIILARSLQSSLLPVFDPPNRGQRPGLG